MEDTIFSKIIRGEIPCYKVYEDDHVFAFLDIAPLSRGHVLVIPKEAVAMLHDLSENSAMAIGRALPKLCRAVMKATGVRAYNILQNNGTLAHQAVMYVHFHVIPKYDEGDGLGIRWGAKAIDKAGAEALAKSIADELVT